MAEMLTFADLQQASVPSTGPTGTNGAQSIRPELFADVPLTLGPEAYPNGIWSDVHANYNHHWSAYKGWVLNETSPDGQLVYPAGLNSIRPACVNHASVFLGQYADRILRFGVSTELGVDKEVAEQAGRAINLNWVANQADNLMLTQSLFQQILGGYFFKIDWQPVGPWPLRYEVLDPRAVFPVWDGTDYERLICVDIIHQMTLPTAQARYRARITPEDSDPYQSVTIHEHWDENYFWVKVDGEYMKWADSGAEMNGPNPWQDPLTGRPFIPLVYTPRIRTDSFFGESLVPSLLKPQLEQNNLVAHLIDGVADAMHQQPWVAGRPSGAKGLHRRVTEWLNLGMGQFGQSHPSVGRLPGARIEQSVVDFVMKQFTSLTRELGLLPDIAYGRNEASVRSALTLAMLFWPATSVAQRYRLHASTGARWLHYKMACMALTKGVKIYDVVMTREICEAIFLGHKVTWPPMLPQDRAELMSEITNRISAKLISPETAIERLDGPDAVADEIQKIDAYRQKLMDAEVDLAKRTAEAAPTPPPFTARSRAGGGKPGAGKKTTTQAQAQGGRASPDEE